MSTETMKGVPTVEVTLKYLDSLRRAVGLYIDPETAEVEWTYAHTLDLTATIPISRRSISKWDGNTSPVLLELTCGARLATFPKPPAIHSGSAWKAGPLGRALPSWRHGAAQCCR